MHQSALIYSIDNRTSVKIQKQYRLKGTSLDNGIILDKGNPLYQIEHFHPLAFVVCDAAFLGKGKNRYTDKIYNIGFEIGSSLTLKKIYGGCKIKAVARSHRGREGRKYN